LEHVWAIGLRARWDRGLAGIDFRLPMQTRWKRCLERKGDAMTSGTRHPTLDHLAVLVGEWEIEATHRLMPGTVIRGRATFEWLEGGVFLIWRAHYDHPDIPDSIAILSCDDAGDLRNPNGGCAVHYFDERGVTRLYTLDAVPGVWRFWRDAPGFSQRFTGTFSADGNAIAGVSELCQDGTTWVEDLPIRYQRIR
jgi:hypothetical protein